MYFRAMEKVQVNGLISSLSLSLPIPTALARHPLPGILIRGTSEAGMQRGGIFLQAKQGAVT